MKRCLPWYSHVSQTLFDGQSMISRLSFSGWILLGVVLSGCSSAKGTSKVTCPNPTQTKTWLLSEVDDSFENHPDASFPFPLSNGTGRPVSLRVRSIGCSCYQLRRGSTRLKVGDRVELGTAETETLVLYPPRPTVDRTADYHFSVEYEWEPGQPLEVISCQGVLVGVSEVRVNPTLLTAEFLADSPPQTVRLEVTRSARQRAAAEEPLVVSGWPPGAEVAAPEPLGEAVEEHSGLWKRNWRIVAQIPKPESKSNEQEFWPIQVSGPEPDSPRSQSKLMIRFRSGLSGPRIVHFGDVKSGQLATRRIQVIARDNRPFRILGPSDSSLALSIQPVSTDAVKSHWGNLTFLSQTAGEFENVMQIETDHPEQANLEVEVRAHVIP